MTDAAAAPTDGGQGAPVSTGAALAAASAAAAPEPASAQLSQQPAAPNVSAPDWLKEADEITVGYVQNKGWDNPAKVVDSYRNLEKLLGADKANNAIVIPKEGADPKEWAAVFDRLGRPTGPDGYKVELPAGGNADMHNASLAKFHELGLTKAQGENLMSWFNGLQTQSMQQMEQAKAAQFAQEDQAIKQEWGNAYTQELAKAQQAARGLGLDATTIDKLSDALGHAGTMRLLNSIGSKLGEDKFVGGDRSDNSFGNAMTPAQAKAEIQTLMQDREFSAKLMNKDSAATQRWTQLHQWAFPE